MVFLSNRRRSALPPFRLQFLSAIPFCFPLPSIASCFPLFPFSLFICCIAVFVFPLFGFPACSCVAKGQFDKHKTEFVKGQERENRKEKEENRKEKEEKATREMIQQIKRNQQSNKRRTKQQSSPEIEYNIATSRRKRRKAVLGRLIQTKSQSEERRGEDGRDVEECLVGLFI